jgi:hypothetical protein
MNIDIEDLLVVEKIEEAEVPKIGMGRNKSSENKIPEKRNNQKK